MSARVGPGERLTEQGYWDQVWHRKVAGARADLRWVERSYFGMALDRMLASQLQHGPGARFLEVGCGGGKWLTYFHLRFHYAVHGCDYSDAGCALARERLQAAGIEGTIIKSDLFALDGRYDVVFSAGLVEHFDDAQSVVSKFASILGPRGQVVTLVPNLAGLSGGYHRVLKPETFETHRVVTLDDLRRWHRGAGLEVTAAGALGSLVPHRFPREKLRRRYPRLYRLFWLSMLGPATWATGRAALAAYRRFGLQLESEWFSPYLYVVARRA